MDLLPLRGAQTAERYKKYEVWTHQIPDGKVTEVCKSRDFLPRSHKELIDLHDIISSHDDEKKENDINYGISSQSFDDICQLGKNR